MARTTSAERMRKHRERLREEERQAALGLSPVAMNYAKDPFSAFMKDRHLDLYENLDAFGVFVDGTHFDEDPQQFRTQAAPDKPIDALQRATALVEIFIEAAGELATTINEFKLAEIERAIENAFAASAKLPRDDVEALKASFAEIDRLKAIRTGLRTPKRHTIPATTTKGE